MDQITIYTTPTCPWCNRVKDYLSDKGVEYREVDVAQDPDGARKMIEISGQRSVPVTVINGNPVVGFKPEEISQYLQ